MIKFGCQKGTICVLAQVDLFEQVSIVEIVYSRCSGSQFRVP
jgi:hypothetical protein